MKQRIGRAAKNLVLVNDLVKKSHVVNSREAEEMDKEEGQLNKD